MNDNAIILTENVLDIFRKKNAGQHVSPEEIEGVIKRFRELVNTPQA
jgi:hypothetical protein